MMLFYYCDFVFSALLNFVIQQAALDGVTRRKLGLIVFSDLSHSGRFGTDLRQKNGEKLVFFRIFL